MPSVLTKDGANTRKALMSDNRYNDVGPDDRVNKASKQASLLSSAHMSQRRRGGGSAQGNTPPPGTNRPASGASAGQVPNRRPRHGRPQQPQQPQQPQRQRETLAQFALRNAVYILSVAAVAAIAVLLLTLLRTYAPQESPQDVAGSEAGSEEATEYANPLDWNNLNREDDHYEYVVNGQVRSKLGVDVSEYQAEIDWAAVVNDGIDFAIIRLGYRGSTEGDLYLDEYYQANLESAKAAGLECGVYFFSQAKTVDEAVEEADFVIEQLHGTALEYPVAFDSEEAEIGQEESRVANLDAETMTAVADAFCKRVEAAGYRSIIYGNEPDLSRLSSSFLQSKNIWWAQYDTSSPSAQIDIAMWQYTYSGNVAGINTGADMNIDLTEALSS